MKTIPEVVVDLIELAKHYPHPATKKALMCAAEILLEHSIDCADADRRRHDAEESQ